MAHHSIYCRGSVRCPRARPRGPREEENVDGGAGRGKAGHTLPPGGGVPPTLGQLVDQAGQRARIGIKV